MNSMLPLSLSHTWPCNQPRSCLCLHCFLCWLGLCGPIPCSGAYQHWTNLQICGCRPKFCRRENMNGVLFAPLLLLSSCTSLRASFQFSHEFSSRSKPNASSVGVAICEIVLFVTCPLQLVGPTIFGKMVLAKYVYADFTSLRMCKMSVSVGTSPSKCNKRVSKHLLLVLIGYVTK